MICKRQITIEMSSMSSEVVIIGAGIGGLVSAALLAARGHSVTVIEKESWAGGKARSVYVDDARVDGGPTVFTLRDVFDEIFQSAGENLENFISIRPAEVLARHAWNQEDRLDLYADQMRCEDQIGLFAGAKSVEGYRRFRKQSQKIYESLNQTMMRASKPKTPFNLIYRMGLSKISDFSGLHPYRSLWTVLGEFFPDQRLRQLFARYSTYCGSSPFKSPATLMLIAHVEALGVWLIDGGIAALADGLKRLGEKNGATFRFDTSVDRIELKKGRVSGVVLSDGDCIASSFVISNADPSSIHNGLLGPSVRKAVTATKGKNRSLSALVWYANGRTSNFPLKRHNVFFSEDYQAEFSQIEKDKVPDNPTIYVCAQDQNASDRLGKTKTGNGRERLQVIVNAPANGDRYNYSAKEKERCTRVMIKSLARCGLELEDPLPHRLATPNEFEKLWPSTGGALYGRATHGWAASFLRPGARTKIPGLYCAGGSTHPGAGVPMAALSGQIAANTVTRDHTSTKKFHQVATDGGTSMQLAKMDDTG